MNAAAPSADELVRKEALADPTYLFHAKAYVELQQKEENQGRDVSLETSFEHTLKKTNKNRKKK